MRLELHRERLTTAVRDIARCIPARGVAIVIAVVLVAATLASAQALEGESRKNTITGTVVNAVTRAPVPRALVTSGDSRYAMLTDSSGHFEFNVEKEADSTFGTTTSYNGRVVATGDQVWLTARKPGFLTEGENGVTTSPGQEATIALTPEALIVGRVAFSTPDTTSAVSLQLYERQTQEGLPRWMQQTATTTNSAGEFRFAGLHPGLYKLSTTEALDNDPAAMIARAQAYGFPPVYYPGASDFETAGTIQLTAGQTVEADLPLTRQPYYQVRIPVNGDISGGANIVVSPQGHRGPGYSLGINALEHRIDGMLPNGNYVVDAITYGENAASGTTNLRVAGGPANGNALTMVPSSGIVLNVKDEFSGHSQPPTGTMNFVVGVDASGTRSVPIHGPRIYLQATFEPADDFGNGIPGGLRPPLGPNDDALVLTNVPPGHYWLRLTSSRGYVASATMGAIDLLHQPLTVTAGGTGTVDITMRDEYAFVEGTVTVQNTASPKTPNNYTTVDFVPLAEGAGQFQEIGAGPDGNIGRISLVPGGYRVLAFSGAHPNLPYRDPQAMKAYEMKGQVIHLEPGQQANLQLQVVTEEQ
jgi:hypothetical protein